MSYDLKNKVVFITGGSMGIGAAVAEYFLKENVKHVANVDIAEDVGIALQNKLNEKYGENKTKFIKCDVSDDAQLLAAYDAVVKEQGYIDIVLNNAGIMNDAKDKYKKEIEINVGALTTGTLKAFEQMRKDEGGNGGVVVNISSIAALSIDSYLPIYCGTKSFVLLFSSCIGLPTYYDKTGVRVLTLCFGPTGTSLLAKSKVGHFDKEMKDALINEINKHPLQKTESAAQSIIDAIKVGESGSTWLSIADKPAQDITDGVKKAYDVLRDLFINA